MLYYQRRRKRGNNYPEPTYAWDFSAGLVNPLPAKNDTSTLMYWDNYTAITRNGLIAGKNGVPNKAIYPNIGEVATFNKSLWSGDTKMSVHFRVKFTEVAPIVLICRRDSNNSGQMVAGMLVTADGKLSPYFWIGNSGTGTGLTAVTNLSTPINVWVDVVYVRDNGNLKVYLNGALSGETTVSNFPTNTSSWYVGRDARDNNAIFRGGMELFNFWREVALTPAEVLAVSNS